MQRDSWHIVILFLAAFGVSSANGSAFLEEDLPLLVSAATPTELIDPNTTSIRLSASQTITVVFSRAVLALGSDFGLEELPKELVPFTFSTPGAAPGRFRWVTSTIARWDPIGGFPTDIDMDLIWNTDLKTYDGASLKLDVPERVRVTTDPLRVTILGVGSRSALELTDEHWDSERGLEDDSLPEVPPDGSIVMRFSYQVELAALQSAAKVMIFKDERGIEREDTNIHATVKRCTSLNTTLFDLDGIPLTRDCAVIELEGDRLEVGTRYAMVIPEGTRYNQEAGPLSEEVFVEFFGLRRFRIPFLWNLKVKRSKNRVREQDMQGMANGRRVSLWLPHGLSNDTSLDDLKSTISLEWFPWRFMFQRKIPMDFELELISKGVASITADFKPAETYKLYVNPSDKVRDGYGLPLQQSETKFTTSKLLRFAAAAHRHYSLLFDSGEDWDNIYPILSRGDPPVDRDVKIISISPETIEEALYDGSQLFLNYSHDIMTVGNLGKPEKLVCDSTFDSRRWKETAFWIDSHDVEKIPLPDHSDLETTNLDLGPARNRSGMMFIAYDVSDGSEEFRYWHKISKKKIMILDYHFFATTSQVGDSEIEVMVWLVDMQTGAPAEGVRVHAMENIDSREQLTHIKSITTDKHGIASYTTPSCDKYYGCPEFVFWVEQKTSGSILFEMEHMHPQMITHTGVNVIASLTVDRALVEPNDTIRIIGHVVKRDGGEVNPLSNTKMKLVISPNLDVDSDEESETIDIQLDEYGAFEHLAYASDRSSRQTHHVVLRDTEGKDVESLSFGVGEPRLPTATLDLITPPWLLPGQIFNVEVQVSSFLGAAVAGAEMELVYWIDTGDHDDSSKNTVELSTNSTGGASHEFNLSEIGEVEVGDVFVTSVIWIGPTRERLSERAHLRIQNTDKEVELKRLVEAEIPWMEFGVMATVDQVLVGEVKGLPVEISLFELPSNIYSYDEPKEWIMENYGFDNHTIPKVTKCTVISGDTNAFRDCRMSLPDAGYFALRGCLDDRAAGNRVTCEISILGESNWTTSPLGPNSLRDPIPKLTAMVATDTIPYGDPLEIFLDVPYNNFSVLVMWGNMVKTKTEVFTIENKGFHRLPVDIKDDCLGKCDVRVQLGISRQKSPIGFEVETSIQYDPMAPTSQILGHFVAEYENENRPFNLNVSVSINGVLPDEDAETPAIWPGQNATVSVNVMRCPGKPTDPRTFNCEKPIPAENARVLVLAVNKAYLDAFSGTPLVDLAEALESDLIRSGYERYWKSAWFPNTVLDSSSVFKKAEKRMRDALNADPWKAADLVSGREDLTETIESSDRYFSTPRTTPLTILPNYLPSFLGLLGYETHQPSGSVDTGVSARSPVDDPEIREQINFQVTPLFQVLHTQADGNGEVQFNAPDNLGSFAVRAYAATTDAQHGSGEAEIIVRLPLSLTPSTPRLARVGDEFEAGTIITLGGDEVEGVPVTVKLLAHPDKVMNIRRIPGNDSEPRVTSQEGCPENEISCLVTLEEKVIVSDADGQVEVRFRFQAERLGDATITIRADAPGANDAVRMTLPVIGQQEAVQVATSFPVKGTDQANAWEEGIKIPEAVPGTGTLELRAGIGKLPSVLSIAESLIAERPDEPFASFALANITLPSILGLYGFGSGDEVFDRATKAFHDGQHSLSYDKLTSKRVGLLSYRSFSPPSRTSIHLNAWGIWVTNQLEELTVQLENFQNLWRGSLEKQIVEDGETFRKYNTTYGLYSLAKSRLALGPRWSPPMCPVEEGLLCAGSDTAEVFSMSLITEKIEEGKVLEMSVETRAEVALTWLNHLGSEEGKKHPDVAAILDSFRTSFRVVGQTAYISNHPSYPSRAGMFSQAMALLAFVRAGETGPVVEKLVNHVASGGGSGNTASSSPSTRLVRMLAMAEYDRAKGSSNPDLALTVRSGESTLLKAEFRSPTDPVVTNSTSFESLGDNPGPVMFTAQGHGEVSMVATLDFIPSKLIPFPTYRGLFVERCIQKAGSDGEPKGPCLSGVALGAQLLITLQITTPDDLGAVTIRALMPGGIEPIDPTIAGDRSASTICAVSNLRITYRFWYWPLCPRQETRPSVVTFKYERLRAGTHTLQFVAVSVSAGDWVLPPVRAYVDDQPEVMGLTSAGYFRVCDQCEPVPLPVADAPKSCPKGCSGSGVCDLTNGVCECDAGFTGADCGQLQDS